MSGSEPGEMALESSRAMVMPKFDMHTYTSIFTTKDLKEAIMKYCIPTDLHPCLPPPGLTMDKLSPKYTRIYIEQLEQRCLRIPFSTFFLVVIRHFGMHISQLVPMVSEAMPWRHTDTDVRDDFLNNYNEEHAAISVVSLCPSPHHLLYVCGLTTVCRHPELSYTIKNPEGKGNTCSSCADYGRLFTAPGMEWNGCEQGRSLSGKNQHSQLRTTPPLAVGEPIPEKSPSQKAIEKLDTQIDAAKEKKDKQNLAKNQAKRTISITLLHQAAPKPVDEPITFAPWNTVRDATAGVRTTYVEKEGVEHVASSDVRSFHSAHHEGDDESTTEHQFVSEWGLRNDLRICFVRVCKELNSHLATPAQEEFLSGLSNVEFVSRAYQTLRRCVLSQGELLKRHELLNHDHVDLRNRSDTQRGELNRLRTDLQIQMQANSRLSKQLSLLETIHSSCSDTKRELADRQLVDAEEKIQLPEEEKNSLVAQLAQAEMDCQKIVKEFIPVVVHRLHTSVEYWKSLVAPVGLCFTAGWLEGLSLEKKEDEIAKMLYGCSDLDIEGSKTWKDRHRELFTMQYPYVQKFVDSYLLSLDDLMKVSSDVPAPAEDKTRPSTENDDTGLAR
ncbi:hypothetical protein Tco_1140123 [Tanacetum coccineum]